MGKNKVMKTMVAMLLCTSLVGSTLLTGCGSKQEDKEDKATATATQSSKEEDKEDKEDKGEENKEEENKGESGQLEQPDKPEDLLTNVMSQMNAEVSPYFISYDSISREVNKEEYSFSMHIETMNIEIEGRDDVAKKINDYMATQFEATQQDAADAMASMDDIDVEGEKPQGAYETYISIERFDEEVLSFVISSYAYTGGAHPSTWSTSYVFDTRNGEIVKLEDIATDLDAMKAKLTDSIVEYLKYNNYQDLLLINLDTEKAVITEDVLADGNWYLTSSGISFISDTYVITPYAAGSLLFDFTFEEAEYIKDEYASNYAMKKKVDIGKSVKMDINGDGKEDEILYEITSYGVEDALPEVKLTINGTDFSSILNEGETKIYNPGFENEGYYLFDLDTSDNFVEIAIQDMGASDDPVAMVFRYDGENLTSMGYVYGYFGNDTVVSYGNGSLRAWGPSKIATTHNLVVNYEIVDGKFTVKEDGWKVYKSKYNADFTELTTKLIKDVKVKMAPVDDSEEVSLTADDMVYRYFGTDNKEWLAIKDTEGKVYFLKMKEMLTTAADENLYDIFENVYVAG